MRRLVKTSSFNKRFLGDIQAGNSLVHFYKTFNRIQTFFSSLRKNPSENQDNIVKCACYFFLRHFYWQRGLISLYKRKRQRPITFKVRDLRLIVHALAFAFNWDGYDWSGIFIIRIKWKRYTLVGFVVFFFLQPETGGRSPADMECFSVVRHSCLSSYIFFSIWCCWCLLCLEFWKWWIAYTWGCVPLYTNTIPPLRSFFLAKTFWSKGPAVFTPSLIPSL